MKIGIISDIHDYHKELETTLNILKEQQIEEIICCGD